MLALSFLLGATVEHFKLPTASYLDDGFSGASAWYDRHHAEAPTAPPSAVSRDVDRPDKTCDGFTALSTDHGAHAMLVNMRGDVVHRWAAPFSKIWPRAPHVSNPVDDDKIYFFACYVYANGDLLAVCHGTGDTPYGYGLVKLDKDSRVLWTYDANVHHAVNVGEDGTICVLTHEIVHAMPRGLEFVTVPALVDSVVVLSADGKELKKIPLLEAFRDSDHALLLPRQELLSELAWDVLHANAVEVLSTELAPHFPLFRAGQLLVSLREIDTIAVLDVEKRRIVWTARGPWRRQHDPHFLANGRLLIFDNAGSALESRVLEYDPKTHACPWFYADEDSPRFVSQIQGRCQRLGNGNTLIVDSHDGALMEVTPARELAWSCLCHVHVPWARRYAADYCSFLPGGCHARP